MARAAVAGTRRQGHRVPGQAGRRRKASQSRGRCGRYLSARVVAGKAAGTYTTQRPRAARRVRRRGLAGRRLRPATGPMTPGPTHGNIAPPGEGDNSTFWPGPGDKGFGTAHYQKMLFGTSYPVYDADGALRGTSTDTMRNYFLQMSKGQYTVGGSIADWVTLPYPESYYGRNDVSGDDLTGPAWRVARDAVIALDTAPPGVRLGEVRHAGPLRHRRRHHLRRARRLRRPPDHHPRRRRRVGRRRHRGRGRPLGALLVDRLGQRRRSRQRRRLPDPRHGRRHAPAGHLGSAPTRSIPKTAPTASSATSSRTIWVCPTSTTPPTWASRPRASGR